MKLKEVKDELTKMKDSLLKVQPQPTMAFHPHVISKAEADALPERDDCLIVFIDTTGNKILDKLI